MQILVSIGLGWGLIVWVSEKFSGDANTGPQTTSLSGKVTDPCFYLSMQKVTKQVAHCFFV